LEVDTLAHEVGLQTYLPTLCEMVFLWIWESNVNLGLHRATTKSRWEHCRILRAFDHRFFIEIMHTNMVNSLFTNVGTNVDLKGLNPENIHDTYLDVEVEVE